jgi:hypothetical protein
MRILSCVSKKGTGEYNFDYLERFPSLRTESTAVDIDVDVDPSVPVFLRHAFQQVDSDHLRLDAVETHIPAEFNSDTELGLENRQLVVYGNGELGQTA